MSVVIELRQRNYLPRAPRGTSVSQTWYITIACPFERQDSEVYKKSRENREEAEGDVLTGACTWRVEIAGDFAW